MTRLKKVAYSYSELLMQRISQSNTEMLTVHVNSTNKIGEAINQDEEINVNIDYYIRKEDVEYIVGDKLDEDRWESFCKYIKSLTIVDFDDLQNKLNYNAIDDINRKLPNEDLSTYELETFEFKFTGYDYDSIDCLLKGRYTKLY